MNREIKFRVWDVVDKKFLQSVGHFYKLCIETENDKFIIQQFTGLKDKNDKDIYEGDILKISELDSNQNAGPGKRKILQTFNKAIIIWNNERLCYYYSPIRKIGANIPHQMLSYGFEPQIIGNIFENPELLNKSS
jgi:uncharacterized phage protein (TIGR01671 family)